MSLIVAAGNAFAVDDEKIIEAVEKSVKTTFFPADVKVNSVEDVRFFQQVMTLLMQDSAMFAELLLSARME